MTEKMPGDLQVLEIASGEAASYAARYLRVLGALVTKVVAGERGPASLPELDLHKQVRFLNPDEAPGAVAALASRSDVVLWAGQRADLHGLRPSLDELRSLDPRLITAAVTPFGESGPCAAWRGTDLTVIHSGGLGYGTPPRVLDPEREHPLGIPGDVTEPLSGLVLVLGVLEALLARDREGVGRHVEVSAQEAVASLMFNNIATFVETGKSPGRLASDRPGARRQFLPSADGLLVMMATRPHHMRSWLQLLGPDAAGVWSRLSRGEPQASLAEEIAAVTDSWTTTRTRREVTDLAQAAHIPVEPVLEPGEVLECRQLEARGFWEAGPGGVRMAGHLFGPTRPDAAPRKLPASSGSPGGGRDWRGIRAREGPLGGVRVLDLTWVFAGPIASRILATLGATVLKVEAPGEPQAANAAGRPFLARTLQGGKLSLTQDLNDARARAAVRSLAEEADVLIENFSTGVLEKHGLGWEELSRVNPRLVMTSISGMGRTGPYAHHVMLGQLAQGYSGLTSLIGYEGGPPRGIEDGGFWSDPVTGYAAAAATIAALRERETTGIGRRIDISLTEATAATLFRPLLAAARGEAWERRGNYHALYAPHDLYRCAGEDSWVAIAVGSDEEWARLAPVIGGASLAADVRFATSAARQELRAELRQVIEEWSRGLTPKEAAAACQAAGVAAAPCNTTSDLVRDEHLRARGLLVEEGGRPTYMRLPWLLHPASERVAGVPPSPGQHTSLVLGRAVEARG